jgi:hypothetical protein
MRLRCFLCYELLSSGVRVFGSIRNILKRPFHPTNFFHGDRCAGLRDLEAEIRKNLIGSVAKIIYEVANILSLLTGGKKLCKHPGTSFWTG